MRGGEPSRCARCGQPRMVNRSRPAVGTCRDCRYQDRDRIAHWTDAAACRGLDTEDFYVLEEARQRQVKAVCRECPVVHECLAYALANGEEGIWGGTTENERRRMQGKRAKYHEPGQRLDTPPRMKAAPAPPPAQRVVVRRDDTGWWAVTRDGQQARAASWGAAIDFANRIATTS